MSWVFGDESGGGGCVWNSGDSFPEEPPWNKHISVNFSENGLPQRTKFLSHPLFTNCDVSRVFGSKSGCGVVACGMLRIFVQMCNPCRR